MKPGKAREILLRAGAIKKGHFKFTSGLHADTFVDVRRSLFFGKGRAEWADELCRELALATWSLSPDVIVGVARGGIEISQSTAEFLSQFLGRNVHSFVARKDSGIGMFMICEPDRSFIFGKNVIIVDDVLTTGGSVVSVGNEVRHAKGIVAGVGVICNRGGVLVDDLDIPTLTSLVELDLKTWASDKCPLCQCGIPIEQT